MPITYRLATCEDIPILVKLRILLQEEEYQTSMDIEKSLYDFFETYLEKGTLFQYVGEIQGKIVSTGAILVQQAPPSFTNLTGKRAYLTSMYTFPEHRKNGYAHQILSLLIEETKKQNACDLWVISSEEGIPLYKGNGFQEKSNCLWKKI